MIDDRKFDWLIAQNEGQYVEFKQSVSDSLGRAICAFANAGGGTIILGVGQKGSLVGITNPSEEAARVQAIARCCSPPVRIAIRHFLREKTRLMAVEIPAGQDAPHSFGSTFYLRVGATSQSMNRDEIIEFLYSTGQVKYEEKICPGFRYPADFNVRAFHRFLKKAKITAAKDRVDTLANLGLASRSGRKVLVNNAGVLFFAKEPKRSLRHGYVDCVLFQGTEKMTVLDRKEQSGNLIDNVDGAMVFLQKHLSVRYQIEGLYRKEILELPPEALREALLNAVIHRDYHFDTAWISVEVYKDRVEISSPGGLPPGLKPEEFGKKSVHRNRLIAEMFQRLGEVERVGAGIRKIRESMEDAGLEEPKFEFTTFFTITFWRPKPALMPSEIPIVTPHVTPHLAPHVARNVRMLLRFCIVPRSRERMQRATGIADRKHFRKAYLLPALKDGLLAMTIPSKPRSINQKYVTTEKGRRIFARKK